jgi:type I restriction enzyme R subunit
MDEFGSEQNYLKQSIEAFENAPDPQILIVVDKLLTGFDAPCNSVLYIDKRLKDHNILQAIARVNRLFDGKDFGLVIDYRGIFGELDAAIKKYDALSGFDAEDIEGTFTPVEAEIAQLRERHANVWSVFNGVTNRQDTEAMQQWLRPEDVRQSFYEALNGFAKTLQIAVGSAKFHESTDAQLVGRYIEDLKRFRSLRAAVKQRYNEAVDYREYEDQIRNMVDKYIGAEAVRRIIEPVDIFQVNNLDEELGAIEGAAAKADFIASRVKKTCIEKMEEDPILWQKLSEVIDEAIKAYLEKRMTEEQYLQTMLDAWKEAKEQGATSLPAELEGHPDARAYFRLLLESLEKTAGADARTDLAAIAAETALKAMKAIEGRKIRDWTGNRDVENGMLDALEELLYGVKGRYEIALKSGDMDEILAGIMRVAKRRDMSQ